MSDEFPETRVTPPPRLFVDALGYVWQDGATPPNVDGSPTSLSMARTTTRNLPSPGLIEYRPFEHDARCISLTDSEHNDVCDCKTLRLIDAADAARRTTPVGWIFPSAFADANHPNRRADDYAMIPVYAGSDGALFITPPALSDPKEEQHA